MNAVFSGGVANIPPAHRRLEDREACVLLEPRRGISHYHLRRRLGLVRDLEAPRAVRRENARDDHSSYESILE